MSSSLLFGPFRVTLGGDRRRQRRRQRDKTRLVRRANEARLVSHDVSPGTFFFRDLAGGEGGGGGVKHAVESAGRSPAHADDPCQHAKAV